MRFDMCVKSPDKFRGRVSNQSCLPGHPLPDRQSIILNRQNDDHRHAQKPRQNFRGADTGFYAPEPGLSIAFVQGLGHQGCPIAIATIAIVITA
jgi:hypothetical protein